MSSRTRKLDEDRNRQRRTILMGVGAVAVLVVVVLLVASALSGDDSDGDGSPVAASKVSMIEMAFDPDPIESSVDDAVFRIVNDGEEPHSMLIPDLGKGTPDLRPGQELVLDLTEIEPGEYYVFCDIPGHREAGMETTLILTEE